MGTAPQASEGASNVPYQETAGKDCSVLHFSFIECLNALQKYRYIKLNLFLPFSLIY